MDSPESGRSNGEVLGVKGVDILLSNLIFEGAGFGRVRQQDTGIPLSRPLPRLGIEFPVITVSTSLPSTDTVCVRR